MASPTSVREPGSVALSVVIAGGTVFDGTGGPGRTADVLIEQDRVVEIGPSPAEHGALVVDATGLAVTPGFINVLSHAWSAMQKDGSAESELRQGVTTEVFGESASPGPTSSAYAAFVRDFYGSWTRAEFAHLGDGLDDLVRGGVSPNVASFVGGANLRTLGAGFDDRRLTSSELQTICALLDEEMRDGALGLGTALIYPPGRFADTDELVALCEVVAAHDGLYISHLRSEGDAFSAAVDELMAINERAGVRAEIYHLKAAGRANWPLMADVIDRITVARDRGRAISANMYPYEAGGTSLASCIPPKYHEGGPEALAARLTDERQRRAMALDMTRGSAEFENLLLASGGGRGVLLLRDLTDGTDARGRTLDAVGADLGVGDEDALLEIVARDPWIQAAFFIIDPANIELGLAEPWVSIGSDSPAHPATPPWTDDATHPRTYGTFARVLGPYVRERGLFTFAEAVRRMTSLSADTLRLTNRGRLGPGYFADVVVLDPATVADTATWTEPHSYSVGVQHVLVNGEVAVLDGEATAARPGRRLRRGIV